LVDVVEVLPPRSVESGGAKVKLSASRETLRRSFCPACKGPYLLKKVVDVSNGG
jgi:hypothetical protein